MSNPTITLRDYQREALHAIDEQIARGQRRTVIVLPTGTGKTVVSGMLAQRLGTPMLVLIHREILLDQHAHTLRQLYPSLAIGVEQAARRTTGDEPLVLASIPTLAHPSGTRLARLAQRPWRTVIIDEVHHAPAKSWHHVIQTLGCLRDDGPATIGFTATPYRSDGVGLQSIFKSIAYQRTLPEMIRAGYCCDIRGFAIQTNINLDTISTDRFGDFDEAELSKTLNTRERNTLIVETWRRLAEGRRTLVFAADILHANALALSFRRAGISAASFTHHLSRAERHERLTAFKSGQIPVLTSISTLTEGYDDPPLSCLLLARPTTSPVLYAQMLGRATRIFPDKTYALLLDVVDTSSAHQIQSISTLFGLPPKLNLKGRSAIEATDNLEQLAVAAPALDPDSFASVDDLLMAARSIPMQIEQVAIVATLAYEVTQEARFAWVKLPSGDYVLPLPNAGIRLRLNLLDHWEILQLPERLVIAEAPTRPEAFARAEALVADRHPELIRLASQTATWRHKPPSDSQQAALVRAGLTIPATRGEANTMLNQLQARRQIRMQEEPATNRQRRYLQWRRLWQEGMSKGEARQAIIADKGRQNAVHTPTTHQETETAVPVNSSQP